MPVVLSNEKTTPYPVKQIDVNRIDSNLDYFVIRKELNNRRSMNIGEIKIIDDVNSQVFLSFLDTRKIELLGEYNELAEIFEALMQDFDIISITDEDTSAVSMGGSVGFDSMKYFKYRQEVIERLFNKVYTDIR